jgi:1,4-alpha-glucan branching enzyme
MPKGYLLLVLHAHLPYVRHPEYDRFLEERWFFEAVAETYIPLIKSFDRLQAENVPFQLALSISPTLANMMEDPLLRQRCLRHLDLSLTLAEKECERTKDWPDVHALAQMYRQLFEEARTIFVERCGTRLVTAFQQYAESGNLELITCAGTHGYLPLLSSEPATVRAQIFTAVDEHARIFGSKPKGMWVPECAFYPGLDEVLAQAGIRYFLVDGHGIEHAEPAPAFGVHAPVWCPSGVAAFGRHALTSKLVWSTSVGYPADPNYREYYRDIGYDSTRTTSNRSATPRASARTPASSTTALLARRSTRPFTIRTGPRRPPSATPTTSPPVAASRHDAPAAGCRCPAPSFPPTTRNCSATGGSRGRSGSTRSCANWHRAATWN